MPTIRLPLRVLRSHDLLLQKSLLIELCNLSGLSDLSSLSNIL